MFADVTSLFPHTQERSWASEIRILQLTNGGYHSNIYPETPVWLSDGRRFLISNAEGYAIASLDGSEPETVLPA